MKNDTLYLFHACFVKTFPNIKKIQSLKKYGLSYFIQPLTGGFKKEKVEWKWKCNDEILSEENENQFHRSFWETPLLKAMG